MSIIFSNFTALLILLAAPILVFAYREKAKGKEKKVSSLFLIKKLKKIPKVKNKIKLPLKFYLELACLILIGLALALPNLKEKKNHIVFLIDNSLSMRAEEGFSSRFKSAIDSARNRIEQERSANFTIFSTTPKLTRHGKVTKKEALKILSDLRTVKGKDNLETAINDVLAEEDFVELQIVSDKKVLLKNKGTSVIAVSEKVGSKKENSYIKDLSHRVGEQKTSFNVSLAHSGRSANTVSLGFHLLDNGEKFELAREDSVYLATNEIKEVKFSLPNKVVENKELVIKLEANNKNALKDDDEISFRKDAKKFGLIYLVSDEDINLDKISKYEFKNIRKLDENAYDKATAFIFYKKVPEIVPKKPSLYILPDAFLFGEIKAAKTTRVSSWEKNHPLTRYLKGSLLSNRIKLNLKAPPTWAKSVISTEEGSVFYEGEIEGVKIIVSGIDLLPFNKNRTTDVLLLNSLAALSHPADSLSTDFYDLSSESETYNEKILEVNLLKTESESAKLVLKPLYKTFLKIVLLLLLIEVALRYRKAKLVK